MCRQSASRWASCFEGRRSPASIFRIVMREHPTQCASASWVRSSALRRRLIPYPKDGYASIQTSLPPATETITTWLHHEKEERECAPAGSMMEYSTGSCSFSMVIQLHALHSCKQQRCACC